jgi:hypothetical protein
VDLDYKGLTNAGTWFIGRLQTERDKMRVLDGLETVSSEAGTPLKRGMLDRTISNLGKRVFLLHNVHEEEPIIFHTRWAMSYLRGPLTRVQIQRLMGDRITAAPSHPSIIPHSVSSAPPSLSADIPQRYLPVQRSISLALSEIEKEVGSVTASHSLVYSPAVLGEARVHFVDARRDVNEYRDLTLLVPSADLPHWDAAQSVEETLSRGEPDAQYDELPPLLNEPDELKKVKKDLIDHLYRTERVTLFYSPILKEYSTPKEPKREFILRLRQKAREVRDEEIDDLERKYEKKIQKLNDRMAKAQVSLEKKKAVSSSRKQEIMVSVGESVLGMFMGRRSLRSASTAMSKYRQSKSASMTVEEAEKKVKALKREIKELEDELTQETNAIREEWDESLENLEEKPIKPRKSDIDISLMAVAWMPQWHITYTDAHGTEHTRILSAW